MVVRLPVGYSSVVEHACGSLRLTFRREMHVGGVFPNRGRYACLLDLLLSTFATPSDRHFDAKYTLVNVFPNRWLYVCLLVINLLAELLAALLD